MSHPSVLYCLIVTDLVQYTTSNFQETRMRPVLLVFKTSHIKVEKIQTKQDSV